MPPHKYIVFDEHPTVQEIDSLTEDLTGDWRLVGAYNVGSTVHFLLRKDGPGDLQRREEAIQSQDERDKLMKEAGKALKDLAPKKQPWEDDEEEE